MRKSKKSKVIMPAIGVYAAQGNTFEKNAVDEIRPNQLKVETILYQSGPNLVKSTEYYQLKYVGYGQVDGTYNDNGRSLYKVYIRYYIPHPSGSGYIKDTGWHGSDWAVFGLESVTLTFYDVIDPFAPPVRFTYYFEYGPYGGPLPLGIPMTTAEAVQTQPEM
jgi:hypothetical protein